MRRRRAATEGSIAGRRNSTVETRFRDHHPDKNVPTYSGTTMATPPGSRRRRGRSEAGARLVDGAEGGQRVERVRRGGKEVHLPRLEPLHRLERVQPLRVG